MSTMKPVQKLVRLTGSSEHLHLWLFAFIFICQRNIPADTHFTIPWLTSTPRAFPFEMFIWILLPRPYLSHPHFVLHWTFSFAMGKRDPPLPLTVLSKDKKYFETWKYSGVVHICIFCSLFSLATSPHLVGMKPLVLNHFFFWIQFNFHLFNCSQSLLML